jgi:hypothetical protein
VSNAEVVGLTDDGERLVLRLDHRTVEVSLAQIREAERRGVVRAPEPVDLSAPLTPKVIQQRIRCGESAEDVARSGGWPVAVVARYEGPVLAEREHHAAAARRAELDGQVVEALVVSYLGEPAEAIVWDSWLVSAGRWEVSASAGGRVVRLRWEPRQRRVMALDDASRRAVKQAAAGDALTAILRPVSTSERVTEAPTAPRPVRRARAQVPLWEDISLQVSGRTPAEQPES